MTLVSGSDKNAHFLKSVFMYHCAYTHSLFGFILWIYLNSTAIYLWPLTASARTTIYFIKFILVLWKKAQPHHSIVPDLQKVNTEGPWKAITSSSWNSLSLQDGEKVERQTVNACSGLVAASAVSWSSLGLGLKISCGLRPSSFHCLNTLKCGQVGYEKEL